jgi:hypothetical protein
MRTMNLDGQGTGKLVRTGHSEPLLDVRYDISHAFAERRGPNGEQLSQTKAIVHSIAADGDAELPPGDFDLLAGGELLRVKHLPQNSGWLVLSSNA